MDAITRWEALAAGQRERATRALWSQFSKAIGRGEAILRAWERATAAEAPKVRRRLLRCAEALEALEAALDVLGWRLAEQIGDTSPEVSPASLVDALSRFQ
jgi:hypothetical protein